ncbi:hypothetical protein D3C83_87070 [compost metagenome]
MRGASTVSPPSTYFIVASTPPAIRQVSGSAFHSARQDEPSRSCSMIMPSSRSAAL